jgi:hypothetical protein
MVHERNVDVKHELLQLIFDAAGHVKDAAILHKASEINPM